MRKLVMLLAAAFTINNSFAIAMMESSPINVPPACNQYKLQMGQNHKAIDSAYTRGDACTMGKLMMQNRQIFESHQECFPRKSSKVLLANPGPSSNMK